MSRSGNATGTNVTVTKSGSEVRYESGKVVYVETLVDGRWCSRYWNGNWRINLPYQRWFQNAFQLVFNGSVELDKDWQWVSAADAAAPGAACHFVVELSNAVRPVDVKVHTMLDGTAILTRYLEIRNRGRTPLALTGLSVWSGRVWGETRRFGLAPDEVTPCFEVGHFTLPHQGSEGWLNWTNINREKVVIEENLGHGFRAPFFILRNAPTGEMLIGGLAWSANWRMIFDGTILADRTGTFSPRELEGVAFGIGPSAKAALRVIEPGETITTPVVHLGLVEGDLDAAVQAMHDHVRRSVLPPMQKDRLHRVQYGAIGDQGYLIEEYAVSAGTADQAIKEIDLTDGLMMPHVLRNFAGQTLAFPPEAFIIGCAEAGHMTYGSGHHDTFLRNLFTLTTPWPFALTPSLEETPPERLDRIRHYVRLYKEFIRPILPTCRMFHHAPNMYRGNVMSGGWFAVEFAAPDRRRGWATIVRLGPDPSDTYHLHPRGLDRGERYRVMFDNTGETAVVDGPTLVNAGLPVRLEACMSSELILFEAV